MRRIDELHLEHPFYGARRLAKQLEREGYEVGRLHVTTLMRRMGIEALYRRPRTSIPGRDAKVYPYLLDGLAIERPNQVWASDLTYLPMAHGFLYLVAILDVASRKVLSFRVSNTMMPDFCVDVRIPLKVDSDSRPSWTALESRRRPPPILLGCPR